MIQPSRRHLVATIAACAVLGPEVASAAAEPRLTVWRSAGCGCCLAWVAHMGRAGYRARVIDTDDLAAVRTRNRVPNDVAACHTALIDGYVLEGHVPAEDVRTLLRQRPRAIGLAVPGMPLGAAGMEQPDGSREGYSTLLLLEGGARRTFARH
ncbi:MAG: hypothetical protein DI570_22085 [Phenylobacterium zucineum]|nr:MAG: hypothetical protein DI570_22085 [Phenylobacterium zucineum]